MAQTRLRVLAGGQDLSRLLDEGLTWSAADPGGFESASLAIPELVDVRRGDAFRIEVGLATAFDGRVSEVGKQLSGAPRTQLAAEGHGAKLKRGTINQIWIDRDLTTWRGMSTARKVQYELSPADYQEMTVNADESGQPSVDTQLSGVWTRFIASEAWYDAQDIPIGALYYNWSRSPSITNPADPGWFWDAWLFDHDAGTGVNGTGDLSSAGPGGGVLLATSDTRTFAMLRLVYTAAGGTDAVVFAIHWYAVVLGRHGLTLRFNQDGLGGFWPSDIFRDAVFGDGGLQAGVVHDAPGLVVAHYVQKSKVAKEQVAADMGRLMGWHWGTWDIPMFGGLPQTDFRPYPDAATCWVSRADCDDLDLNLRLADLYDTVEVGWTDSGGRQHTTVRTRTIPELQEADLEGQTYSIQMGVADEASAAAFGDFVLAIAARNATVAGSCVLKGDVQTPAGPKPACLLQPGVDKVMISDLPNLPLFGGQNEFVVKHLECTASREGIAATVELGRGADLLETLQARTEADTMVATFGR